MDTPKMSYAELLALYDKQEAERKALKAQVDELQASRLRRANTISIREVHKRGEKYTDSSGVEREGKGVLSVQIGGGRFPISLYPNQWRTLEKAMKEGLIEKAIEANKEKLSFDRDE